MPGPSPVDVQLSSEGRAWITFMACRAAQEALLGHGCRLLVVESGLQDHEIVAVNQVDQSMLFADSPGPGTSQHVAQWFGLAYPAARVAQRIVDETVDPLEGGSVGCKPVGVVLPPVRGEDEPQLVSLCSCRWPDWACCRLSISRLALAGTRSRCAVSSRAS